MVNHSDVDEALRLMECSKESLYDDEEADKDPDMSVVSQIFRIIKSMQGGEDERPAKRMKRGKKPRRFGKGPGGQRDMDVDDEDDAEDDETLRMVDVRARVTAAGFTEAQLMEAITRVSFTTFITNVLCY